MWLEDPNKVFFAAVASVVAGGLIIGFGLVLVSAIVG